MTGEAIDAISIGLPSTSSGRRFVGQLGRSTGALSSSGATAVVRSVPLLHPSVDPALGLGRSCVASTESKRSMPVSSVAVSAEIEPQPTVAPITEGAALIKKALESALESWRVGGDVRALRRTLLRVLAEPE